MHTTKALLRTAALMAVMFLSAAAYAQNIVLKGKVTDKADKTPIAGATVALVSQKDSTQKTLRITDAKGSFQFSNLQAAAYLVKISYSGYEKIEQKINLQASNKDAIPFAISKIATDLTGVIVVAKTPPVRQKGDTSEFSASQFKVNPDATAEDLVKKLPGITVAKDGTVTAMGEQVKKVTVDGRDFFGDDATAALKNLPADVIDKIQVFDKLSDQAQLTGFDDGNSVKTVNIVTKNGVRNGQFGRIYAGVGTDGRYTGGGNVSFFEGNRRISLVGNFNNINQQNFAGQDLLGVISSGGGGGGGGNRGGGGGGRGGNANGGGADNFSVGQASGINKTNAAGINFSNQYGTRLTVSGSYFYNNSHNVNESFTNTETFFNPKNLFSQQKSNSVADNNNHRINMRIEYKLDSSNSLFIIPSLSFQTNKSVSSTLSQNFYGQNDSISLSDSKTSADRNGYNIRNSIMFRHAFAKRGRTFSISFNTGWNKNDGESVTDARYRFYNNGVAIVPDSLQNRFSDNSTNGNTISANFAYTEPVGKKGQLQFDYTPSMQKNKSDQQTFTYDGAKYTIFDTTLSNLFNNTITTNNAGINYRLGRSRDEQLSFGVNFQHSKLESDRIYPTASSVNQTYSNILPNAMYRKKIGMYSNIRVFYRASTNFPSVNQLQDVVNLSNPLRVSSGNPDLKQSYTHFLTGRYSYTNSKTSKSFFANLMLQTAADYISSATYVATKDSTIQKGIILKRGSQLTKPTNLDGYQSLRTFFTYSMPLKFIKTTLNFNTGFSYSKLPGFINNVHTITNSYGYNAGVVFASNISEYIDFNISYGANFNNSNTSNTTGSATKYVNQTTGAQVNLLSKKGGWFLQNDVTGNNYSGLSDGFNQNFWLWNAAIGKKILKKNAGEIKLSVFDLLKQNQSLVRTVTGTYIEDAQTQVLQQYFMLTFTYKLKNFGTGAARPQNGYREFNRPMGGGFVPGF